VPAASAAWIARGRREAVHGHVVAPDERAGRRAIGEIHSRRPQLVRARASREAGHRQVELGGVLVAEADLGDLRAGHGLSGHRRAH
jgi:hypothetical protein